MFLFYRWLCRSLFHVRGIPEVVPDYPKAGKHRELERAEIKKSEDAVQRTMSAVRNFTNPFSIPDKDHLYSLASGAPVSVEVEIDVLRAEALGKEAKRSLRKWLARDTIL